MDPPPKSKDMVDFRRNKNMEKPLSFHHFQRPGHGARLSSSRFGWQSCGRGSLRLSFVPWAALKYGGFGWWPWRLLTFFCLIWWGHKVYMHNEWNISAGIHMYVVYTCMLYTSLHWWIFIYTLYTSTRTQSCQQQVTQKWRICLRLES